MDTNKPVVSVEEAREILGLDAVGMSDEDIVNVITTLDLMAKDALQLAREQLHRKRDAKDLANLIYDIYQDKKKADKKKDN